MNDNIHTKISNFISKNYTFFAYTIPTLLIAIGLLQPDKIITLSIGLGKCTIFHSTSTFPIQTLWLIGALAFNLSTNVSLIYTGYRLKEQPRERLKHYTYWRNSSIYSIFITFLLWINSMCYENILSKYLYPHTLEITLIVLSGILVTSFFLIRIIKKEILSSNNNSQN